MNYAVIDSNNIVVNVIVADYQLEGTIPLTSGGIGWTYNTDTNTFTPPQKTQKQIDDERDSEFQSKVDAGYNIPETSIILPLSDNDRNQFANLLVLLKEGIDLGKLTNDTDITIKDIDGNIHTVTIGDYKSIIFDYGFYYKTIWDSK